MIAFGANFNQLDEICRRLGAKIILANARKRISDDDFSQGMQRRPSTRHHRNFRFEKEIEFAGKRRFRAARAFGDRLDAAQTLGAPGNDETGIAKLAFAKKNRRRGLHGQNLARE